MLKFRFDSKGILTNADILELHPPIGGGNL